VPAQITHELFAEDVVIQSLGKIEYDRHIENRSLLVLGAQGPDLFLHNHRTLPSGLIFGKLLHTEGYGAFTKNFTAKALELYPDRSAFQQSPLYSYLLGFVTHAALDRRMHPFINFYSGWTEPGKPDSEQYRHCHAFFERILDVFILKYRSNTSIEDYNFLSHIDCGQTIPENLADTIEAGISSTFPEYDNHKKNLKRIRNAYLDTHGTYTFTNPTEHDNLQKAVRQHGRRRVSRRIISIFHPTRLPELDYMNMAHAEWNHPGAPEEVHKESFFDLYEQALDDAAPMVKAVKDASEGIITLEALEESIGNQNLSDGKAKKIARNLEFVKPLPLIDVLDVLFAVLKQDS
jgi:hypothetical protein